MNSSGRRAFTLIELLVVIAIIAILSVVVVLTLNPAELLRQSRDANRVSDLSTLNEALNIYSSDQSAASGYSLGVASSVSMSIADPSATSTAGDQCQGLGLFSLGSSTWDCTASSSLRVTNGNGWLPVNFSAITSGSPFGNLPVDPTNQTSSGLYYSYIPGASTWEIAARLESQKYATTTGIGGSDGGFSFQYAEAGKDLTLAPTYAPKILYRVTSTDYLGLDTSGLVGYWPLNEGNAGTAYDQSGNGNNGTWIGTQAGTNGYYTTAAKTGPYAGSFNGSNNAISIGAATPSIFNFGPTSPFSVVTWVNFVSTSTCVSNSCVIIGNGKYLVSGWSLGIGNNLRPVIQPSASGTNSGFVAAGTVPLNTWAQVAFTFDGSMGIIYVNAVSAGQGAMVGPAVSTSTFYIGESNQGWVLFPGAINDVRIYNRALSATEIQQLYNSEK